jgi:hypothetical protein
MYLTDIFATSILKKETIMKKLSLGFLVCFFALTVPAFGQVNDKDQYKAIDPFDYKLDERSAVRGAARKFKSVVQFISQSGTVFSFSSLDRGTTLSLTVTRHINQPAAGQTVTIYYTATKRIIDSLMLDDIDINNTTEEGIGLIKSGVSAPAVNRSIYREIDPFDYKIAAENAQRGDTRRYKSSVQFSAQSGITYYFISHVEGTMLSLKARQRFPQLSVDQRVTIYYTAIKGVVDSLSLDDVEL